MSVNQKQLLQSIYDLIFDTFTTPPSGAIAGRDAAAIRDKTHLALLPVGNPIDIGQFANAWSPDNPTGSTAAAENFALLVDAIPNPLPIYLSSGKSVDSVYGEITGATPTPVPIDPANQAAYDAAFNLLNVDGTDYDDSGRPITVKVDSPLYRNYKNKQALYNAALASFLTQYLKYDLSKSEDQRAWSLLGPALQAPLDTAWNDFVTAQKAKIETAIATIQQYQISSITTIFANARRTWEQTRRASVSQPGLFWHTTYAFPGNWFASGAASNFSDMEISSNSYYYSYDSRFSSWSGGGSYGYGFWRTASASVSRDTASVDIDTATTNITVKFKLGRIEIRRPWLNPSILTLTGWNVPGRSQGSYSNGKVDESNSGEFPLLPTAFLVARDIYITADWGTTDYSRAESSTSASAGVSWGPFALSGRYKSGQTSVDFKSQFDKRTIAVPGIQIIGWLSTVVPSSPPS